VVLFSVFLFVFVSIVLLASWACWLYSLCFLIKPSATLLPFSSKKILKMMVLLYERRNGGYGFSLRIIVLFVREMTPTLVEKEL
jgi:hypothetical protein